MIADANPFPEIDDHGLVKAHRPPHMLVHLPIRLAVQTQVAPRLTAAEGTARRQEMQGRPDPQPPRRVAVGLNLIDTKPQARSRQAADIRDGRLDQAFQLVLGSLAGLQASSSLTTRAGSTPVSLKSRPRWR